MSVIGDELASIVDDLAGVGVVATVNPAQVMALAVRDPVAALVSRPESIELEGLHGRLTFDAVVILMSRGPDAEAEPRLLEALPDVLRVLQPVTPSEPDRYTRGDLSLAAYRIESPRIVPLESRKA